VGLLLAEIRMLITFLYQTLLTVNIDALGSNAFIASQTNKKLLGNVILGHKREI